MRPEAAIADIKPRHGRFVQALQQWQQASIPASAPEFEDLLRQAESAVLSLTNDVESLSGYIAARRGALQQNHSEQEALSATEATAGG